MIKNEVDTIFPFPKYRPYQKETILECIKEFEKGTEIIIIDGPIGFGKSPVNLCLGKYFKPSYYTTPQKKLREQLGNVFGIEKLAIDGGESDVVVLKARKDYICRCSNQNSEDCKFRKDPTYKCSNNPKCTYWKQKEALFKSDVGILTFSNLIVNSYLPIFIEKDGKEKQISFEPRKLLIIDECHSLENQVASLHAGFKITPNSFPKIEGLDEYKIQREIWDYLKPFIPQIKASFSEIEPFLDFLNTTIKIVREYRVEYYTEFKEPKTEQKINELFNKITFLLSENKDSKKWIVNIEYLKSWETNIPYFKPINIDNFLQKHVWWYANKYLLTSATIPYQNNIEKWLKRIGLGNKTFKLIKIPMLFPKENRPIYLDKIGGSLSWKNQSQNWNGCIKNVKEILTQYKGKQGVIHVSSYQMMWNLFKELKSQFSIFLYNKDKIKDKDIIQTWIKSKKEILISPSIFEGVDLKDDLCRFQILFKVPYANLKDGRVNHLLYKKRDQEWYNNETMMKITQAYGRAIRSETDYADFYIIDGDFLPFYHKVVFPEWFKEAIIGTIDDNLFS